MITKEKQLEHKSNFEEDGKLYLVRCYNCDEDTGKENWAPAVAMGYCVWCGWGREAK